MVRLITTVILGLMLTLGGIGDTKGRMDNYQCVRCGELVRGSDHTPADINCRAGGLHRWQSLGEVGQENYSCKRCDTWVEVNRRPTAVGCPIGGQHEWVHLGHVGPINYQCERCHITITSNRTPKGPGCSQGGNHQWVRLDSTELKQGRQ